ncbi:MAG: hypothetical protein H6505_02415 [Calditrichaeota bacterium]|nr:hypothetical protein [Calditrichota bacterium]
MMIRLLFVLLLTALISHAERPRVVVERDSTLGKQLANPNYFPGTDSTAPRMVIDPAEMIYQMRVDSINKVAEEKIRDQIIALERNFEDPEFEEKTGRVIGTIVMQQQMALLDLQIERAISLKDTLLLMGIQVGLGELLKANPMLEYELLNLDQRIAKEIKMLYEHTER